MADEQLEPSEHWEGEENIPGASERHAHAPSDVDAMGNDKRRQVVGKQYGATARKQLIVYGTFVAITALVVIAFLTVVTGVDNRDIDRGATAPWAQPTAPAQAVRDIDFPRNGPPPQTIPEDEIGRAVPPTGNGD